MNITAETTRATVVREMQSRLRAALRQQVETRRLKQERQAKEDERKQAWQELQDAVDAIQPILDKIDTLMRTKQPRFVLGVRNLKPSVLWASGEIYLYVNSVYYVRTHCPCRPTGPPFPLAISPNDSPNHVQVAIQKWAAEKYVKAICAATDGHGYIRCTFCGNKSLKASEGEDVCPDCKRKAEEDRHE